ncbi:class A beta-lactamase-related serine hydrolase [Saccharopolyspora sp. 6T]|uniref:serine hydrolase n=1 Tax=Saccharopolyspora sp. 6T TaxID=2877238 RepID=UPI001CD467C5|nr:serine hydrolase [Saccharopolyspora sp. 6T]MCA1187450.1 class A beta-lactamase-related serine hydrolase [Saccharopolyspora sp. 6T]
MPLSRRTLLTGLTATAAALPLLSCSPATALGDRTEADLSTADGWLTWIAQHRDRLALVLTDTTGPLLAHRAGSPQPLASAVKAAHLAAYATAVADGRLDPAEQVRVGDWERYYVPTDGGAHVAALQELGIPTDDTGAWAADPDRHVTLEQLATAMIGHSDSAVPDLLRDRLGTEAVRAAALAGGWPDADVRSLCAEHLFLLLPAEAPAPGTPLPRRREIGFALERRHRDEQALRDQVRTRLLAQPLPDWNTQLAWATGTAASDPAQLAALHRSLAEGTYPSPRAAEIARGILERRAAGNLPDGVLGLGYKGGSLPGVLTAGISLRLADGRIAAGSLLAHGGISAEQLATGDPGQPLIKAVLDPAWRDRLRAALRG